MRIIRFELEETENCFISLAHMFGNEKARKEYVTLQLDNKIEFPSNELEIISRLLINYDGDEDILLNYDIARELNELKVYSDITEYAHNSIGPI